MKKINSLKSSSGFIGILGIVITLAIICVLILVMFKDTDKPSSLNNQTKKALSDEGIDISTYKTTIDSTKKKLNRVNKDYSDRLKQLEELD